MNIQAIDVHAHFGTFSGGPNKMRDTFMSADAEEVVKRARSANVSLSLVSPLKALVPRFNGDPESANLEADKICSACPELKQWVVVDPRKEITFRQAAEMIEKVSCAGIKIHPEEHGYHINEYGRKLFEFAEKMQAVLQTHSGERNSLPEDIVKFADDFPTVPTIISHLGCGYDEDLTHQVRMIALSKHGNLLTDTSSAKSIISGLIEWAVKTIGADRILFGTDSPLYSAYAQRARINGAAIGDAEKELILRRNAVKLFKL